MSSEMVDGQDFTIAELMVAVLSRELMDGDLVAQGIGTHVPTCSYFVASVTRGRRISFLFSVGGSYSVRPGVIKISDLESLTLTRPVRKVSYSEIICDTLVNLPFTEISRPAQVDRFGNINNVVITSRDGAPPLRLPGAVGLPDFTPYESQSSLLYVPRHDRRTLVADLDFRSGAGWLEGQDEAGRASAGVGGSGPSMLVTDLAVIGFSAAGARLLSLHPGVTLERVLDATGFELDVPDSPAVTKPPKIEELVAIRKFDPYGIRDLEFIPAAGRLDRIREIALAETNGGAR